MAASVRNTAEINQPFLTSGQMLKAAVLALGSACFFMLFYRVLEAALNGALDMRALRGGRLLRVYREHTLAFCAAVVLLCWLPHLALSYPGAFMGDTVMQIRQAMGWEAWSAMHPIGVTALMWLLVQASRLLGSGNAAMFGYVAVQSVLAAIVIGYSQQIMRRLGAPRWLRVVGLVACAGAAVYSNNITVILKDIIYVYALLLLLCELARGYLLEGEAYRRSAGYMLRMGLACFLALKARTNGVMIVLPVALVMVVKALRSRDMLGRTLALVLVPFVLSAAVDSGLGRAVYIEPTSSREVLSMPYQQTARFVTKHGDEIPQEEREIIDRVLIYDNLAALLRSADLRPCEAQQPGRCDGGGLCALFRRVGEAVCARSALLFCGDAGAEHAAV